MNWKALFKGDYIAAAEFGARQPTFTITAVKPVKMESVAIDEDDETAKRVRERGVVYFKEVDRGWVLNKTNAICLAAMFGDETNGWIGKRVSLFATPVKVGKKTEPGIRVKGSPDIAQPISVDVKLPKRKTFKMPMAVTKNGGAASDPEPARSVDSTSVDDRPPPLDDGQRPGWGA